MKMRSACLLLVLGALGLSSFDSGFALAGSTTLTTSQDKQDQPAARPNILMFGDAGWDGRITDAQEQRLSSWLHNLGRAPRLALVECGAGMAIPTVRHFCERVASTFDARLIRLNPRESHVPSGEIGIPVGALEGLLGIDAHLKELWPG